MRRIAIALVALTCGAGLMMAQAKQQPKPKSQKEVDAIMAVQNAATPQERLTAIDNLLTKFADTEFKPMVLQMAAGTAQQIGDMDKAIIYAERSLEADPKSFQSMLLLAQAWASRTKEFDLDKEEKLARAEKYAKDAMETLKTAEKPNPAITDEQWAAAKKDLNSQGHEALGSVAMVRKKYDVAIAEYKVAADTASSPDPATLVRLAGAYGQAGQWDQDVATLDKVLAMPDVHPQIKAVATQERARALQAKNGGAKPAAPKPTVPQVEIK
jgi:tetratricopeptide (TPR) repeat protein